VLISKDMTLSAKLSDMGISKRMSRDMSSLGHLATGKLFFIIFFYAQNIGFVTLSKIGLIDLAKQN